MKRDNEQRRLIDLGAVTEQTLGGAGIPFDLVRDLEKTTGISDD